MVDAITIRSVLKLAHDQLAPISESPSSDAQVILAALLDRPKAWLLAHPEQTLSQEIKRDYCQSLDRLCAGEPLPYVLGTWEFFGRRFKLSPSVLIPRPESEGLIEIGLDIIDRQGGPCRVVDVGTGSGCLAITLAAERSRIRITAVDRSLEALKVAVENAQLHDVQEQIDWVQADLLEALGARFDLMIANLPYIPSNRLQSLPVVKYEPRSALDGGMLGTDLINRLISALPERLAEGGTALLEIDESHGEAVVETATARLPAAEVRLMTDLAGLDRYVTIHLRGTK